MVIKIPIVALTVAIVTFAAITTSIAVEKPKLDLKQLFKQMKVIPTKPKPPPIDFKLFTPGGQPIRLSDIEGKIVLLNFWASWCHECVAEMPSLEQLHRQLKDKGLLILGINLQETVSRVNAFYQYHQLTLTTLMDADGEVGKAFYIQAIPTSIILDKNGQMIGFALGPRKWDSENSVTLFTRLLEQP